MVNATITMLQNATGIYDIGEFANISTGYMFWTILLSGIYIIFIVKLYQYGVERAIASASFACLILSLPLVYLQWISVWMPILFTIMIAGSLIYLRMSES